MSAPYVASAGASALRQGTVVIVSGGARGVTATSLQAICKHGPHLALLGRTALVDEPAETRAATTDADIRRVLLTRAKATGASVLPKELARESKLILDCREIRGNVAALEKAGAKVSYHAVDVRSAVSVASVVDSIRKAFGPIGAIVHGAGVLADALIGAQTDEQFDLVFGTKVDGLHHLLAATRSDPVETLVVFSSVAGRFGNAAQSAYSMANDALSAVAAVERARRGGRCVVRSLAWGPWAGGMVTPGLAKLFEKAGVQLIALDAGAAALGLEMAAPDAYPQVVLMNGAPPAPGMLPCTAASRARPTRGSICACAPPPIRFSTDTASRERPSSQAVMVASSRKRTARAHRPEQLAVACRDIRVLRGIPVDGYDQDGVRLTVRLHATSPTSFEMKLVAEQDRPRYAAVVDVAPAYLAPSSVPASAGRREGVAVRHGRRGVRERPLSSRALRHRQAASTLRLGERARAARSRGLHRSRGVGRLVRRRHPPRDGGVQIAALWGTHLLGRLPLAHPHRRLSDSPRRPGRRARVRCLVRGQRAGKHRVVADVAFVSEGGEVLGTMTEIDFHLPPVATRGPGAAN